MIQYPILRIPPYIEEIFVEEIPVPEAPKPPQKPVKENASAWNFLVLLIPLLFIQLYLKVSMETVLITGALGVILIMFYSIQLSFTENANYKMALTIHDERLKEFRKLLAEHEKLVERIRNSEDTKNFRENRVKAEILNTNLPCAEIRNLNKGYSEDYFYHYLINRFPNNIFKDIILEDFGSSRSYQPDFVFQDQETMLHIDIEIDEPYTLQSKDPIHYSDGEKHLDYNRDLFFNENGWIVIRFAEEQIIKYPENCCDYIADIIFVLTKKTDWKNETQLEVEKVKAWSFEDSLNLIAQNYREEYIKEMKNAPPFFYNKNKTKILLLDSYADVLDDEYDDGLPF